MNYKHVLTNGSTTLFLTDRSFLVTVLCLHMFEKAVFGAYVVNCLNASNAEVLRGIRCVNDSKIVCVQRFSALTEPVEI